MKTLNFYGILITLILTIASCTESDTDVYGTIYGRVSDATTNEPVSGASVTLNPKGSTVVTGEDGTFEYKKLESGKYTIQVSKTGFNTENSSVTVGASKEIQHDIRLHTESFKGIFGYVKDAETDANINGAIVTLDPIGSSVSTDNSGRFEFKDPQPGEYTLRITKSGYQTYAKKIIVESGKSIQTDVLLYAGVGNLRIDNPLVEFGKESSPLACNIRNTGTSSLSWEIQPYSYEWIKSVSPMSGSLGNGAKSSIIISVDRTKLTDNSPKTAELFIESDGGISVITVTINKDSSGGGDDDNDEIVIPNNLIAYYNFDNDQLSPELIDNSGNNNEARIVSNPAFITDTPTGKGKAISLKASNKQYINIKNPYASGIENVKVKRYSINFWIKDFGGGMIYSLVSNSYLYSNPYLYTESNNLLITIPIYYTNYYKGSFGGGINDYGYNKWHMMTYTFCEGLQTFYMNGKVYNTIPKQYEDFQEMQNDPFHFGGNGGFSNRIAMDMKIDNIRFYNRDLSQDDVKTIYNSKQ